MLSLSTKHITISRDVIWMNKTHSECASRKETTKATSYILQDEDESNHWDYAKTYLFKIEQVKTEKVNTKQDCRGLENIRKTIKTTSFSNNKIN